MKKYYHHKFSTFLSLHAVHNHIMVYTHIHIVYTRTHTRTHAHTNTHTHTDTLRVVLDNFDNYSLGKAGTM
jgi:hypothetical protein